MKISSISTPWGRKRLYVQLLEFMPKYENFKNRPVSWKSLPVEWEWSHFWAPGLERVYVPLIEFWPMAKFQIWQFWKSAIISETARKICSISTSWDRKRLYVQLLELWPMAKFVVKQNVKAHGPLVRPPMGPWKCGLISCILQVVLK